MRAANGPATRHPREAVTIPEPMRFAEEWVRAWNRRDIEAVLTHYADDVVFSSPVASQVVAASRGTVRGKQALRDYWNRALDLHTDLHFTLVDVYAGVDTIVINYRNQCDALVNEILTFRDGIVAVGQVAHRLTGA